MNMTFSLEPVTTHHSDDMLASHRQDISAVCGFTIKRLYACQCLSTAGNDFIRCQSVFVRTGLQRKGFFWWKVNS